MSRIIHNFDSMTAGMLRSRNEYIRLHSTYTQDKEIHPFPTVLGLFFQVTDPQRQLATYMPSTILHIIPFPKKIHK